MDNMDNVDEKYAICRILNNNNLVGTGHFVKYNDKVYVLTNMHVFFSDNNLRSFKNIIIEYFVTTCDKIEIKQISLNFNFINDNTGMINNLNFIRFSNKYDILALNFIFNDNIKIKFIQLDNDEFVYNNLENVIIYGYHAGLHIISKNKIKLPIGIPGITICNSNETIESKESNDNNDYGVLNSHSHQGCSGGFVIGNKKYYGMNVSNISIIQNNINIHSGISLFIKKKYIIDLLDKFNVNN